ncbi:MAG TPA: DUF4249 domain-containing protein [Draconibacterium sp.]|nr:DUF4249 domain-containing protein [Draconibacterium sp.]
MKTLVNIFIGILMISIFFSCEKTIDFNGVNMEPKIVVHGNLMAGYPVRAAVYKSRSLLSDEEFYNSLPNAEVKLYENGIYVETLEYAGRVDTFRKQLPYDVIKEYIFTNGSYSGMTVAEVGKTYRLEISCDGFDPVTCETTVPAPVEITKVDTVTEVVDLGNGPVKNSWIYIYFKDPEGSQNYYMLQSERTTGWVLNYFDQYSGDPFVPSDTIFLRYESFTGIQLADPVFNNNNQADDVIMGSPDNRFAIFNDTQINGKNYKLGVIHYDPYYGGGGYSPYQGEDNNPIDGTEYGNFSALTIKLVSITKEYYDYLNSANYHFWFSDDPFSEPVPVASNVIGGMGRWAASSSSEIKIIKGTYPMPRKIYINEYEYYYPHN